MWAYNETFYQIYPIGFCGAPVHNDGIPAHRILKIGDWAEYLGDLGIGSIILNPIFESDAASGHSGMSRKRNGTLLIKTGFISVSTETVVIMMVSGMKAGKVILNWSS